MDRNNEDFSLSNYKLILKRLLDEGYSFAYFEDGEELLRHDSPFVILRHDVDFDVSLTLPLAEIEAELGITSTYFFLVRSPFYNILSFPSETVVKKLIEYGNRLGLHFDAAVYPGADEKTILNHIRREVEALSSWYDHDIKIISFHRPVAIEKKNSLDLGDYRHTYEEIFMNRIKYFADSGGLWRFGYPLDSDHFKQARPMHLNMHPVWWTKKPEGSNERLDRLVKEHSGQFHGLLEENVKAYRERKNNV